MTHEERTQEVAIAYHKYIKEYDCENSLSENDWWKHFLKSKAFTDIPEADEWIPISERLPEPTQCKLHKDWHIYAIVSDGVDYRTYHSCDVSKENVIQWMKEDSESRLDGFTHWMQPNLPKSPKTK